MQIRLNVGLYLKYRAQMKNRPARGDFAAKKTAPINNQATVLTLRPTFGLAGNGGGNDCNTPIAAAAWVFSAFLSMVMLTASAVSAADNAEATAGMFPISMTTP